MTKDIATLVANSLCLGSELALLMSCSSTGQVPVCATSASRDELGAYTLAADTADLVSVSLRNFARAETDLHFAALVRRAGLGRFDHQREMPAIDEHQVVRMNRDTLLSWGVFDLEAAPVTITLPGPGKRFMSMQIIDEDHYLIDVVYAPATFRCAKECAGTRYIAALVRTLADPQNRGDMAEARALQEAIGVEQAKSGRFEVPNWDSKSRARVRDALRVLGSTPGDPSTAFGAKDRVDPIAHLIGTAIGWGGYPREGAVEFSVVPRANDGRTVHRLTVADVPVDGFWSISVYDSRGFFAKNDREAYSLSNQSAQATPDGAFTFQFGACEPTVPNCLPIVPGWSYTVRLYRPREEILGGRWQVPAAVPLR